MTRDEFIAKMIAKGKITREQVGNFKAQNDAVQSAIDVYKAGKATMTKAQIAACLDVIVAAKVETKPAKVLTK